MRPQLSADIGGPALLAEQDLATVVSSPYTWDITNNGGFSPSRIWAGANHVINFSPYCSGNLTIDGESVPSTQPYTPQSLGRVPVTFTPNGGTRLRGEIIVVWPVTNTGFQPASITANVADSIVMVYAGLSYPYTVPNSGPVTLTFDLNNGTKLSGIITVDWPVISSGSYSGGSFFWPPSITVPAGASINLVSWCSGGYTIVQTNSTWQPIGQSTPISSPYICASEPSTTYWEVTFAPNSPDPPCTGNKTGTITVSGSTTDDPWPKG